MDNYIELPTKDQIHQSVKVIADVINHYTRENYLLAELLFEKGVTPKEIAQKLGIGRAAVSMKYPIKKMKGNNDNQK